MRTAYFDCICGASGDMLLGALVDVGLEPVALHKTISSLGLEDACTIRVAKVLKHGISATQVTVEACQERRIPRSLSEIRRIIQDSNLPIAIKLRSIKVFERLAEVEARIHGCDIDEVHFHEVGAVDSIVDIVGVITGLEVLGLKYIFASALPVGSGWIETAHGSLPLPSPATVELLKGVPVYDSGLRGEILTPTGAALLTEFVTRFGPFPSMKILATGYGAGARDIPERPNILRLIIGEPISQDNVHTDTVTVLETSIDDSSPEFLGYLMDLLLDRGALDVSYFPVHMKKNRPGVQVQVIARPDEAEKLCRIIFDETTTLGVRLKNEVRRVAARSACIIDSPWGEMKVKVVERGQELMLVPEFEECKKIARQHGIPLRKVYSWVLAKAIEAN